MTKDTRLKQMHLVRDWIGNDRYNTLLTLWHQIREFLGKVRKEEQPFQRVSDFVRHAARQKRDQGGSFLFEESIIQIKGQLLGSALRLKCEIIIFADFLKIAREARAPLDDIKLDLSKQMQDCDALVNLASAAKIPRQEMEGHIYYAQFCALARTLVSEPMQQPADEQETEKDNIIGPREILKANAATHLEAARSLLEIYPSTEVLEPEIEATETMLRDGVFYTPVSGDEMRAVYEAMAGEFRGTGHWYTCENGHPFTVGECGMPMEQARCPECGGVVGGQHHRAADGVRHATEIDNLAQGVGNINI
jgi:hypothetical protein